MQVNFKSFFSISLVAAGLALGSCSTSQSVNWKQENPFSKKNMPAQFSEVAEGEALRLVFSSNVLGEVAPCGCPAGPKGGLDRRLNFVNMKLEKEKAQRPYLILDAGNALFASLRLDPARKESFTRVAREILKAHKDMGIQVQNVAHMDMSLGPDFVREAAKDAGLALVSASWVDENGGLLYPKSQVVDLGNQKVLVTGLSLGVQSGVVQGVSVRDPKMALDEVLKENVDHTGPIVVLSDLGLSNDQQLSESFPGKKLIFIGSRDLGGVSIPRQSGSAIFLQPEFRGQQWGVFDFNWKADTKGWFFLNERQDFSKKWDLLVRRRASDLKALEGEENFETESQRYAKIGQDLLEYAPEPNASQSMFYDYSLHNLDISYQKRNVLTSKMNFLIDLKN